MRFISHELRTPLNSVFMGMQLSIDQIPEDTQEPVELERRETLVETQSACGAALDILNELLLFDKLETGALVLHKLTVPVPELVEDSIKMFSVQTREKSVELTITNDDDDDGSIGILSFPMSDTSTDSSMSSTGSGVLKSLINENTSVITKIYSTDEVCVDKNKVVQVIRNVVSNAIKFTPAFGKIQVNLKFVHDASHLNKTRTIAQKTSAVLMPSLYQPVATEDEDDEVDLEMNTMSSWTPRGVGPRRLPVSGELVIEVKDSGAGISEENQKRLFKEVVQFHPELLQNGGGSGLGMCISKGIMDMHGGSISVFSAGEGQGSVFTLRLPMVRTTANSTSIPSVYRPVKVSLLRRPSLRGASRLFGSRVSFGVSPPERPQALLLSSTGIDESNEGPSPCESPISPVHSVKMFTSISQISLCNEPPERQLHFLVVDDSSLNRKMLCRLLRNQGHVCTEAEDGVQAVAIMTAVLVNNPDYGSVYLNESLKYESTPRIDDPKGGFDMILMDFM